MAASLGSVAAQDGPVLVVSSGGVIGHVVSTLLEAGGEAMIRMNLQSKNTGFTRIVGNERRLWLNSFNEAPHLEDGFGEVTYA